MADRTTRRGTDHAPPTWRRGYDALERELAPHLDATVRSDPFAQLVGTTLHLRRVVERETARHLRRLLHAANLPAATDVTRILTELGRLEQQVRELTEKLDRLEAREHGDDGPARRDRRSRPA